MGSAPLPSAPASPENCVSNGCDASARSRSAATRRDALSPAWVTRTSETSAVSKSSNMPENGGTLVISAYPAERPWSDKPVRPSSNPVPISSRLDRSSAIRARSPERTMADSACSNVAVNFAAHSSSDDAASRSESTRPAWAASPMDSVEAIGSHAIDGPIRPAQRINRRGIVERSRRRSTSADAPSNPAPSSSNSDSSTAPRSCSRSMSSDRARLAPAYATAMPAITSPATPIAANTGQRLERWTSTARPAQDTARSSFRRISATTLPFRLSPLVNIPNY